MKPNQIHTFDATNDKSVRLARSANPSVRGNEIQPNIIVAVNDLPIAGDTHLLQLSIEI